jgi:hypothetical protein
MSKPTTPELYYCEGKECEYKETCGRWIGHYDSGFQYFGFIKTCRNKELWFELDIVKEIVENVQ